MRKDVLMICVLGFLSTIKAQVTYKDMVYIQGGPFLMGSNECDYDAKPVHIVYLDGFYMDQYEVTVDQFLQFCDVKGRKMPEQPEWNKNNHPVVNVSWHDAKAYAKWAGKRLPTEAEWEYAAREAVKDVRFGNGNDIADPSEINFNGSSEHKESYSVSGDYRQSTTPVGSFTPNAWGLYDMSGNVWEWCADRYDENYYMRSPELNPKGPSSGAYRVLRGGSWLNIPMNLQCALRSWLAPQLRYNYIGFRCVENK